MKKQSLKDSIGVKLRYADGSVVSIPIKDIKKGWAAAPDFGVQVVSIYHNVRFSKGYRAAWFAGYDYYALVGNEITETNRPSEIPEGAVVKQGSEMDKDAFRKLYNAAMQDYEF